MKIKLSKAKWNQIGRFAGWVKTDEFMKKIQEPPKVDLDKVFEHLDQLDNMLPIPLKNFHNDGKLASILGELVCNSVVNGMFSGTDDLDPCPMIIIDEDNELHLYITVDVGSPKISVILQFFLVKTDNLQESTKMEDIEHKFNDNETVNDLVKYVKDRIEKSHQESLKKINEKKLTFNDGLKDKNGMSLPDGWDKIPQLQKNFEKTMKEIKNSLSFTK